MLSNSQAFTKGYSVLALNYHLPSYFKEMWDKADFRICADGGANKVHDFMQKRSSAKYITPDVVLGDLDSIKQTTRDFMEPRGTKFIKAYDQDYNDLQKSLMYISEHKKSDILYILGGLGGRMDQTSATLHSTLIHNELKCIMMDESNYLTWIRPSDKCFKPPKDITTKVCGLLPLSTPIRHIKTKGLKWDVDGPLSMMTSISSSNEVESDTVSIETTDPFLWMSELKRNIKV